MRRVVLVLATIALAILLAGGVAQAIINGQPDRGPNAHPYVGALVTVPPSGEFKGQRIPVCSGTLISPKVFLTAGHCTDYLIKKNLPTYVSFDPPTSQEHPRLQRQPPTFTLSIASQLLRTKENAASHQDVLRLWALCPATSATT
jgi:hypothetical protein